jgi:hypothetical protein
MSSQAVPQEPTNHSHRAVAAGYLAEDGVVTDEEHGSRHQTLFFLNAGDEPAHVVLSIHFDDRAALGPYTYTVAARGTVYVSLEALDDGAVPRGKDFASFIESDAPIVVLATRRRSSSADEAPLTRIASAG